MDFIRDWNTQVYYKATWEVEKKDVAVFNVNQTWINLGLYIIVKSISSLSLKDILVFYLNRKVLNVKIAIALFSSHSTYMSTYYTLIYLEDVAITLGKATISLSLKNWADYWSF